MPHPSTGGAWLPVPNPFGGAPLAEYRSDGVTTEARPIGVDPGQMSPRDALAYNLAIDVFDGMDLAEAQQQYAAFTKITTVSTNTDGRVGVDTLSAASQAAFAAEDATRASTAAGAIDILMSGKYDATSPNAGGGGLPAGISDPVPFARPVLTTAIDNAIKSQGLTRVADPVKVSVLSGLTSAANGQTDAPPPAAPTAATSTTGGGITAADLGKATNAAPKFGNVDWKTIGIVALVGLVIVLVLRGGRA